MVKVPESYRKMARAAKQQNWTLSVTGSGHLRWTNPQGQSVFTPMTPKSRNNSGIVPIIRKLRKAGLQI